MALNGTVNGSVTNKSAYFTFYFTWSASQNVDGNYSDVTVKTYIKTNNTSWDFDTVAARSHSITINGTTTSIEKRIDCSPNWENGNPYLIQTATTRVYHNSDGTKTITISARSNGTASSYGYSSSTSSSNDATASATVTLNTIPRRSTLSVARGTLGAAQTLTANRNSSSFTHTLTWSSGSYSGTIATKSSQTSWSFTPGLELANVAPNGNQVYISFELITYSGSAKIGSYSTSAWLDIPNTDSFNPTINNVTISENVDGLQDKFGQYVKSKSKLNVSINASGVYGSTIKTYTTSITGAGSYSGNSFVSDILKSSGVVTIVSTVTDSRGRNGTRSTTINVTDYYNPIISELTINRCDLSGTLQDDGTYLSATFSWDVAPIGNKNDCSVNLQYLGSDGLWTSMSSVSGVYSGTNTVVSSEIFDVDSSYSIRLVVSDYFTSNFLEKPLTESFTLINFHQSGHALAIGKISSEDNLFEVDLASKFNKNVSFGNDATVGGFFYDKFDTKLANGLTTYTIEGIDPNTTLEHLILTNHSNVPLSGYWYIKTEFYSTKSSTANRMQTAYPYNVQQYSPYYRYYYDSGWTSWIKLEQANKSQPSLWSGALQMKDTQTITLTDSISNQRNGIVLTFSYYANATVIYDNLNSFFVPKGIVNDQSGKTHGFLMVTSSGLMGSKVLVINDTSITGTSKNDIFSSNSLSNGNFVLIKVYGV